MVSLIIKSSLPMFKAKETYRLCLSVSLFFMETVESITKYIAERRCKGIIHTTTEKKLYDISEILANRIIPMSQSGLYKACKEGKIPTTKIGKRVFIPAWFINELTGKPVTENARENTLELVAT